MQHEKGNGPRRDANHGIAKQNELLGIIEANPNSEDRNPKQTQSLKTEIQIQKSCLEFSAF